MSKIKTGFERFEEKNLIKETAIGLEKIKLVEGKKVVLCSENKKRLEEEKEFGGPGSEDNMLMYMVKTSYKGEYNTIADYFVNKEQAFNYYNERLTKMQKEDTSTKVSKNNTVEAIPLKIAGMDLIEKAYISTSSTELNHLSEYHHPIIILAVANNPFTSKETLNFILSRGCDYETELMILNNPHADIDLLKDVVDSCTHMDKVLIAKANLIKRDLFMDFSRVFLRE